MFQRRHYDLLAWWAGRNLDLKSPAVAHLLTLLADDNPAFQKSRFITACKTHRDLRALALTAGYDTNPKLIADNLDDVISRQEK